MAQSTFKGTVLDENTGESLIGVSVYCPETKEGTVTDFDGHFKLSLGKKAASITLTYVGYGEVKLKIKSSRTNLGTIEMKSEAVGLSDVVVTSSVAKERQTPVALSTITPLEIEQNLGTKEFPEILNSTPGVYATKQGGGFGDSKVNLRGFKSENIAVLVNGIPMNDMEWGGVYWSNWAGLSDVTRTMQVQRGLGASKVSTPSVGGSINVITKTLDAKMGGSVMYGMGNDGYNKVVANFSTGLMDNGWAMTMLLGRTWGDGYIQGTEFVAYNYFLNVTKKINDSHQIALTAFAAPQWHNQRSNSAGLTIEGWQKVGQYMGKDSPYQYNPTYGHGINGERKVANRNEYHKPQISLNYLWQIDENSSWSTAAYVSLGYGGGYAGQGFTSTDRNNWSGAYKGALNETFRAADGTYDYAAVYAMNQASTEGSKMAMSESKNNHNWYGLLSTYNTKFIDCLDFFAGIDVRYYKGIHTNELVDLYGGDYFIDKESRKNVNPLNNSAASAEGFVNEKLRVGDVVYRDYDGYVAQEGAFAQLEYNSQHLNAFIAGSISGTSYWRYDRFYYDAANARSETVNFIGFTAKGGINYNINEHHNIFANGGVISRAPYFSGGAFLNAAKSNVTNPNAVNEKIYSVELGYGFKSRYFSGNINAYYTIWNDKTMSRSFDLEDYDTREVIDRAVINMEGVNARHMGIEIDFRSKPLKWLEIKGMFSIGDWQWNSNPTGYFYSSNGTPLAGDDPTRPDKPASGELAPDHAKMTLNLKGVKVGGSAQTTASLGVNFFPFKGFRIGATARYMGRNNSDWNFNSNDLKFNGTIDFESPWVIPQAVVCDISASYSFPIGKLRASVSGNIDNLFNQEYIMDATDGATHDWKTAYVFYGFGRTVSARMKINF